MRNPDIVLFVGRKRVIIIFDVFLFQDAGSSHCTAEHNTQIIPADWF